MPEKELHWSPQVHSPWALRDTFQLRDSKSSHGRCSSGALTTGFGRRQQTSPGWNLAYGVLKGGLFKGEGHPRHVGANLGEPWGTLGSIGES